MNIDEILHGNDQVKEAVPAARSFLGRAKRETPIVAGWPQVSLLPKEMRTEAHRRAAKRGIVAGVAVIGALTAAAVGLASASAADSRAQLEAESARVMGLQAQIARFDDLKALQRDLTLAAAGERVGASTAIDWQKQVLDIEALKPEEFAITSIATDSATPVTTYEQSSNPLEGTRVATMTVTAQASTIERLPQWLRALPSLPAFVDASPVVSTGGTGESGYTVVITIHLNDKAYITPLPKDGAR